VGFVPLTQWLWKKVTMDVRTEILQEIADKILRVDTLETRNNDEQDIS